MSRTAHKISFQQSLHEQKLEAAQLYEFAMTAQTPSAKSRMAGPGGADGNYHIQNQAAFLKSIAFGRMMEANDPAVAAAANRLVNCVNVGQMRPEPDTGNPAIDRMISELFDEYAESPELCDSTGRWNYETQSDVAFRRIMIDGDILPVPDETGAVLHMEAHRCQTPARGKKFRGVCGVETKVNRPYQYWLTKTNTGQRHVVMVKDVEPRRAQNEDGWPNIFHCYNPKMFTLFRGIGALGAVGTSASRRDDLEFATVLKAQTANCVTFTESVEHEHLLRMLLEAGQDEEDNADVGPTRFELDAAGYEMATADIHPGRVLRPKLGRKLSMESPNIPGEGQLELNLLLLQYLAMCWDLPLMVLLLDARMANFSSFRGIMDQSREAFRSHQRWFGACYHRPRYRNWLRIQLATQKELAAFVRAEQPDDLRRSKLFRHSWSAPAYRYYHPVDDATGDLIQLANSMTTYDQFARRRHSMSGESLRDSIISFNVETYRRILDEKAKLLEEFGDRIPGLQINEHFLFSWPAMTGIHQTVSETDSTNTANANTGGDDESN